MGTWSAGLFESDIACDVRDGYLDYLKCGESNRKATRQILADFADELEDSKQDGPVVWLALAATQWKYGRLEPRVKTKALKIIKAGGDVAVFPAELQRRRGNVLEKLRAQLESPPPAEKRIRVQAPAQPLKKIDRLWKSGEVVAFRRESGRFVLLLTEVVTRNEYVGEIPFFVVLKWQGAKLPEPERIRKLPGTENVIGVWPNKKGEPIPWDRVQKLRVVRPLTGIVQGDADEVYCETGFAERTWSELDSALD